MPTSVRVASRGTAVSVLRELVEELRGSDLLAPLTVVVPSALVGATLRRSLSPQGLAGVRFTSLRQLVAGVLTAAGETSARTTGARRRALAAQALDGSPWQSEHYTTGTLRLFDALLAELDDAGIEATADLGAPDVMALYSRYRDLLPEQDRELPAARATGLSPSTDPLVLYLPRRLSPAEVEFCEAWKGGLHVVADEGHGSAPSRVGCRVEPDAEEEARQAVRAVLAHLGASEEHRADRTAIAYRSAVPYARLLHEQLTAAGLPHHVPRHRSLGQTVSGAALLGLLRLRDNNFARPDVAAWWASAPLRRRRGGRVDAAWWNRLSCDAGATKGDQTWLTRLQAAAAAAGDRLTAAPDDERLRGVLEGLEELGEEMAALFADQRELEGATGWSQAAEVCRGMVIRHLGGPKVAARWDVADLPLAEMSVAAERAAHADLLTAIESLDGLEGISPYRGLTGFRHALEAELDRPVVESDGLARGVIVAPISDLAGADLDLLIVVGMVEGSFPPRAREHPVLRDEARARSGGALLTTADRRAAEDRDFRLALAGAGRVELSYPAADLRSRRATHAAPWFLEFGGSVALASSFAQTLQDTRTWLSTTEYDLAVLLRSGPATPEHPLAVAEPALARGLSAVGARSRREFGPWTGHTAPPTAGLGRSATSLQSYATCPRKFFLATALGLRQEEEPADEASPLDVGEVVHAALEAFFRRHLGRSPDEPWSASEHAEALALLAEKAEGLAAKGRAGRPLVWQNRLAQMRRALRLTLLADDVRRAELRSRPVDVELGFGLPGSDVPPVAVTLTGGRTVELRGAIDRVDETDAGGLVVLDWKTGGGRKQEFARDPDGDLSDRGRNLQLPLYAAAARQVRGEDRPVQAYYVMVERQGEARGGAITADHEARFREVLEVVTSGIEAGVFPANPGPEAYYGGWENCGFCAFHRLCPSSRGDEWETFVSPGGEVDAGLARYIALAEGTEAAP